MKALLALTAGLLKIFFCYYCWCYCCYCCCYCCFQDRHYSDEGCARSHRCARFLHGACGRRQRLRPQSRKSNYTGASLTEIPSLAPLGNQWWEITGNFAFSGLSGLFISLMFLPLQGISFHNLILFFSGTQVSLLFLSSRLATSLTQPMLRRRIPDKTIYCPVCCNYPHLHKPFLLLMMFFTQHERFIWVSKGLKHKLEMYCREMVLIILHAPSPLWSARDCIRHEGFLSRPFLNNPNPSTYVCII